MTNSDKPFMTAFTIWSQIFVYILQMQQIANLSGTFVFIPPQHKVWVSAQAQNCYG